MDNRAAVLYGSHDLRVESRPVPRPGRHQVLVEVLAVGVCGSDTHYYEHGRIGEYVVRQPLILGHEASGVVVAHGPQAGRVPAGTRVALEPGVPCHRCAQCRRGRYNVCPGVRFFATPPIDGALTGYVTIDEDFAHPVPDSLSDEAAALIEPLSVGIWAARRTRIVAGDDVLVTGAGPVGLLCAAAARLAGAASITVTDVNPHRLSHAARYGATATHNAADGPVPAAADVLLECTGRQAAVTSGIHALRPAGRAALIGMGADDLMLPLPTLQNRELTVTGVFRYANTYPAAIAAVAAGRIDLDGLVTHRYDLDHTADALCAAQRATDALKAVVYPRGVRSSSWMTTARAAS
jgi:L-iditol 2-dehydrogenase